MTDAIQRLALIFGGRSTEHEVSIVSATNIANALESLSQYKIHYVAITKTGEWFLVDSIKDIPKSITLDNLPPSAQAVCLGYFDGQAQLIAVKSTARWPLDVAFPALHGAYGEDGTIQGLFRMANLAFVGCDVLSSAISMDKEMMKRILLHANIPTARYRVIRSGESPHFDQLAAELGNTLFLKPANAGSSVGVHKIRNQKDLEAGLTDAFKYDNKLIIEEAIVGRELEVAVMGPRDSAQATVAAEVHPNADFYSYHAKYVDPNGATFSIPADLTDSLNKEIKNMALRCYQAMECEGLARVDFFYNESRGFLVNELNTLPGFTAISAFPKLMTLHTYTYSQLVENLIREAFHQEQARRGITSQYDGL